MAAHTAHAQEQLPPPRLAPRPIKRAGSARAWSGETGIERKDGVDVVEPRMREATAMQAAPAKAAKAAKQEPSLREHLDSILTATQSLPEKTTTAARESWTRTKEAAAALGRDALANVASSVTSLRQGNWRRGSAPMPPIANDKARTANAVELGAVLVDLHVQEVRKAATAFARTIVDVATAIDAAEAARVSAAEHARPLLVALFGDELVDEIAGDVAAQAAIHAPSARRAVELQGKRALLDAAVLADAMRLLGDDWERDAEAGTGKLVVTSADWELAVDVAWSTFRIRDRHTGRYVGIDGAAVDAVDAHAVFVATHFRIGAA